MRESASHSPVVSLVELRCGYELVCSRDAIAARTER